jgi:DNA-binding NtrC family response regulator
VSSRAHDGDSDAEVLHLDARELPRSTVVVGSRYNERVGIRVALADDNRVLRLCIRELLVRMQVEVVEAASGRELAKLLADDRFDAVIADVRMPDGGGVDVLKERRAAGDATAFVMMTGAGDHAVADAQALPDTAVLLKPFSREELRAALEGLGVVLPS